jgi:hypothetical protein
MELVTLLPIQTAGRMEGGEVWKSRSLNTSCDDSRGLVKKYPNCIMRKGSGLEPDVTCMVAMFADDW